MIKTIEVPTSEMEIVRCPQHDIYHGGACYGVKPKYYDGFKELKDFIARPATFPNQVQFVELWFLSSAHSKALRSSSQSFFVGTLH